MELEVFKKLPLGGVDRRALVGLLASGGAAAAQGQLDAELRAIEPQGINLGKDAAVLILGGSNGITRAVAVQLLFGEKTPVYCVHYDSEKMQIGGHHAAAIAAKAAERGVKCTFLNRDATREQSVEEVVALLKDRVEVVHLINGIAAGATKRYEKYGPTQVRDVDIAFDPVLQVPDFGKREAYRQLGLVDVECATEVEIERTNKFMGTSSLFWAEPLAAAGLLVRGESVVAFCDYDYPADDPVYAMGPLAGAKVLQRETMGQIEQRFGVRTVRLCYPAMATTALGAIPGGTLMYALTAQILKERGAYLTIPELARDTMALWKRGAPQGEGNSAPKSELRLDAAYQATLPEFNERKVALTPDQFPDCFRLLFSGSTLS